MNAVKSRVTFRRACVAPIIVLAVLLALASCDGSSRAYFLAEDIMKLGFTPGRAVSLPYGFKAECSDAGEFKGYDFRNGFYLLDGNDRLACAMINSPQSLMPGGVRPGMTKEQAEAMRNKSAKEDKLYTKGYKVVGDKIPPEEQSSIAITTWRNKDLFSLSPNELFKTYGPPSRPMDKPFEDTIQLGKGVAPYTYTFRMAEYIFQTGEKEYWAVRISLSKFVGLPETVDSMTMIGFEPSELQPLSAYKVYDWPNLWPVPGDG